MERWLGIDLHTTNFVVCFLAADETSRVETFPLSDKGFAAFRRKVRRTDRAAVETSGNVHFFRDVVGKWVKELVVVNPYAFAVIAKSKKKTDRHDAAMLARFLKLGWLPTIPVPSREVRELRALLEAREAFVEAATKFKNMAHAALVRNGETCPRSVFSTRKGREKLLQRVDLAAADRLILEVAMRELASLEEKRTSLEEEIEQRGRELPGLEKVLQLRGVNVLTAIGLLSEIGNIGWFERSKQLVSYAGLATSVRQSNETTRRGKITKRGRARLRTLAIRAALSIANGPSTALRSFYEKKKREKGAGRALCATARKLLTVLFVMLKKDVDYWYLEDRLYNRKLRLVRAAA